VETVSLSLSKILLWWGALENESPASGITIPNLVYGTQATGTYEYSSDELNRPPYAEYFSISSGNVGVALVPTIEGLVIPNGASAGTHIYRWYRSLNKTASYEELVGSGSTYTPTSSDVGWYIRCEVDLKQATGTGLNLTGQTLRSAYSSLVTDPGNFSPFADISTWDTSLDKGTASNLASLGYWVNRASVDGNALIGATALPTWDGTKGAVRFTRASSQSFKIQAAGSYVTPYEVWFDFQTPTSFTGTQTLIGLSNTHNITISSAGLLSISAVSTGQTLTTNTRYRLRVVFNGASSTWQLNNGTETAISLSTASVGTPNYRVGCLFNDSSYFDGWIYYYFLNDTGLSAGEVSNMWTWFGL